MRFTENGGRPSDERRFLHKKILGVIGGVADILPIPGGGFIGGVARRLAGSRAQKEAGIQLKFPLPSTLPFQPPPATTGGGFFGPRQETADARCSRLRRGSIADQAEWQRTCGVAAGVGAAVMGQYGAALQPGSMMIDRAVCLRGMQLGNDGLCYNKSQITNKQRMWPAGRKPLLSGGDMRAISIAARAGRRMEGATKRLQRLGMMKKASSRKAPAAHQHAKPVAAVSV